MQQLHAFPRDDLFSEGRRLRAARRPRGARSWLSMGLAAGLSIAGITFLARLPAPQAPGEAFPVPSSTLIAPPPAWQPLVKASPLYALQGVEGRVAHEARRHRDGGRQDIFTIGHPGEPGHARISLSRGPVEPSAERFYIDLVRQAAEAGLAVGRAAPSRAVLTKFGLMETMDAKLIGVGEHMCITFRFKHPETAFGFHGWFCEGAELPLSDARLACWIDRIAPAVAVEDPALRVLFAQAERRRSDGCAPSRLVSVRKS